MDHLPAPKTLDQENTKPKPLVPLSFANGVLKKHHQRPPTTTTAQQPTSPLSHQQFVYRECLKNHAASLGGHALDGCVCLMESARWKGASSAGIAHEKPMSEIIRQLRTSLIQFESCARLSGCVVLLEAGSDLTGLLNCACFGQPIVNSEKDKLWFRLGLEEAYYLCHSLKCLTILGENESPKSEEELWEYMKSKNTAFPGMYKSYSHLRAKNWVVRSGNQYGVDFVAYRHHPALVHSEYAVLVLQEGLSDGNNSRLTAWSDLQCTVRVCGSVAKTLLVLSINWNDNATSFPSCLECCIVEERLIKRWVPQQHREDKILNGN